MNPNTGHLVDFSAFNDIFDQFSVKEDGMTEIYQTLKKLETEYVALPDNLQHAAKVKLNGKKEAFVSLTSGGKLSNWAKEKRKEKIATASRRRNRK